MNAPGAHRIDRVIHDADSHIIEPRGWLESYSSDYVKANLEEGIFSLDIPALDPILKMADDRLAGKHPEVTEALKSDLFGHPGKRNMWAAYGSINKTERSDMLDIAGISSQLVFPSIAAARFARSKDLKLVYGGCEALNRAMSDFCSDDPRLLAVGFLCLNDPELALVELKKAIEMGIKTLWIKADAVEGRAPSHIAYDPLWRLMEEAGMPITLHIGSGTNITDEYMNTGVERKLDGGNLSNIETTKPKDVPVLHHSIERWLTCMILDGVLERFPRLKVGIVELGANWLPACLMNMDIGVSELGKFDTGLKNLSLKPSEYVQRQVRVAPLVFEDVGWVLRNVGKDILMFNTDYPHPEGTSDPFGHFERSINTVNPSEEELDHFYRKNFEDYMGL